MVPNNVAILYTEQKQEIIAEGESRHPVQKALMSLESRTIRYKTRILVLIAQDQVLSRPSMSPQFRTSH